MAKIIENKLKEYSSHNKCVAEMMDSAKNFVKAFKESAATEISKKEDPDEDYDDQS